MKNFPKKIYHIFGVAVVKLRFLVAVAVAVTVAVAVAVGQTTARRGMSASRIFFIHYFFVFEKARRCLIKCMKIFGLNGMKISLEMAYILYQMGETCWKNNEFVKCLDYFENCIKIRSVLLGPKHPVVVEAQTRMTAILCSADAFPTHL